MKDYINLAMRTNSHVTATHGRNSVNFTHACLGMVTELDELHKAIDDVNRREEIGDMCWYIALACDAMNVEWPEPTDFTTNHSLDDIIFILADLAKKWFAYGKRPRTAIVQVLLGQIVMHLGWKGDSIDDAKQRNIAKLQKRFPDKFDSVHAVNRDLNAERKVLE